MKAIGIDLGTTNSAVANYDPGRNIAEIVANSEGDALTPFAVAIRQRDGKDILLVGKIAANWAQREPRDTVLSVKRLMGRDFAEETVTEARKRLSYDRPWVGLGPAGPRGHRRDYLFSRAGVDDHPGQAAEGRDAIPRRGGHACRHHGARVLPRGAAGGHS